MDKSHKWMMTKRPESVQSKEHRPGGSNCAPIVPVVCRVNTLVKKKKKGRYHSCTNKEEYEYVAAFAAKPGENLNAGFRKSTLSHTE